MSIKSKIKTISQKKSSINKKWMGILVGVVVLVVFLNVMFNDQPERPEPPKPAVNLTPQGLDEATLARKIDDEIISLREAQKKNEKQQQETERSLERLTELVERQNAISQTNFKEINKLLIDSKKSRRLPPPDKVDGNIDQEPPAPPTMEDVKKQHDITSGIKAPAPVDFRSMEDVASSEEYVPQQPRKPKVKVFAPEKPFQEEDSVPYAGFMTTSFANGVMLTGVSANTATTTQANPQPLLIKMQDNAFLPGEARYKVEKCFVMASAHGSLSDERAHIRLAHLSCVDKKSKRLLEAPIKGYIVDSDGIFGLRGKLIEKRGAILAKSLLAGFAQGLSDAGNSASTVGGTGALTGLSVQQTTQSAAYSGLSSSAGKLADFYMKEAESMFPVIEINPGRKLFVVFSEGTKLEWSDYER